MVDKENNMMETTDVNTAAKPSGATAATNTEYMRGSIVRIKLNDFMTYKSCEFRPGPRLNMVVGPNGTGKSTIVCAICLGLGGSPQLLGRSNDLGKFVKHGHGQGTIEIELHEDKEGQRNPVIRRIITAEDNKSSWTYNGKSIKQKAVKEIIKKEFNIQVENLCQFLPQDKVGNFTKFNEFELLRETQKAILGQQSLDTQKNLKTLQDEVRDMTANSERNASDLERLKAEHKEMAAEIARMEEREEIERGIQLRKMKRPWLEFELVKNKAVALKEEKKQLESDYEVAREALKPVEAEMKTAKSDIEKMQRATKENKSMMRTLVQKRTVCSAKLERIEESIAEYNIRMDETSEKKEVLEKKIKAEKKMLKNLVQKLESYRKSTDIKERLKVITTELKQPGLEQKQFSREIESNTSEIKLLIREKKDCEKKLKQLDSDAQKKDQLLRSAQFGDEVRGHLKFIADQTKAGKIENHVYGPVLSEVSIKEELACRYFERANDAFSLMAFTPQSKKDRLCIFNRQGVGGMQISKDFRPSQHPKWDANFLKEAGIDGYLDDKITGPPAVIEMQRNQRKIHQILCGTHSTVKMMEKDNSFLQKLQKAPGALATTRLYTPSTQYTVSTSKYTGNTSTLAQPMAPPDKGRGKHQSRLFYPSDASAAKEEMEALEKRIVDIDQEIMVFSDKNKELTARLKASKENSKALQNEKLELENERRLINKITGQMSSCKLKIEDFTDQSNVDWDKEIQPLFDLCMKLQGKKVAQVQKMAQFVKENSKMSYEVLVMNLKIASRHEDLDRLTRKRDDRKDAFRELEANVKKVQKDYTDTLAKARELKAKADREAKLDDDLKEKASHLTNDLDELLAEIEEMQRQLDSILTDPGLKSRYQKLVKAIAVLEPKVATAAAELAGKKKKLDEDGKIWENLVKNMVSKIDLRFKEGFQAIRDNGYMCCGEINLNCDDDKSYDKYGIQIKVKFREEQPMQVLSASVQSGGERSLSTFLYLMAMQAMALVPFRVVDEINQGMDSDKERLSFYRLVEASCGGKLPQYFLITPKLLTGLKYHRDITVLFIFNGEYMLPQNKWALRKFVENKRKLVAGGATSSKRPKVTA